MKVHHTVARAPQAPKPGQIYGARLLGITLNGKSVTLRWTIYGRKNRGRKDGKGKAKAQPVNA